MMMNDSPTLSSTQISPSSFTAASAATTKAVSPPRSLSLALSRSPRPPGLRLRWCPDLWCLLRSRLRLRLRLLRRFRSRSRRRSRLPSRSRSRSRLRLRLRLLPRWRSRSRSRSLSLSRSRSRSRSLSGAAGGSWSAVGGSTAPGARPEDRTFANLPPLREPPRPPPRRRGSQPGTRRPRSTSTTQRRFPILRPSARR